MHENTKEALLRVIKLIQDSKNSSDKPRIINEILTEIFIVKHRTSSDESLSILNSVDADGIILKQKIQELLQDLEKDPNEYAKINNNLFSEYTQLISLSESTNTPLSNINKLIHLSKNGFNKLECLNGILVEVFNFQEQNGTEATLKFISDSEEGTLPIKSEIDDLLENSRVEGNEGDFHLKIRYAKLLAESQLNNSSSATSTGGGTNFPLEQDQSLSGKTDELKSENVLLSNSNPDQIIAGFKKKDERYGNEEFIKELFDHYKLLKPNKDPKVVKNYDFSANSLAEYLNNSIQDICSKYSLHLRDTQKFFLAISVFEKYTGAGESNSSIIVNERLAVCRDRKLFRGLGKLYYGIIIPEGSEGEVKSTCCALIKTEDTGESPRKIDKKQGQSDEDYQKMEDDAFGNHRRAKLFQCAAGKRGQKYFPQFDTIISSSKLKIYYLDSAPIVDFISSRNLKKLAELAGVTETSVLPLTDVAVRLESQLKDFLEYLYKNKLGISFPSKEGKEINDFHQSMYLVEKNLEIKLNFCCELQEFKNTDGIWDENLHLDHLSKLYEKFLEKYYGTPVGQNLRKHYIVGALSEISKDRQGYMRKVLGLEVKSDEEPELQTQPNRLGM